MQLCKFYLLASFLLTSVTFAENTSSSVTAKRDQILAEYRKLFLDEISDLLATGQQDLAYQRLAQQANASNTLDIEDIELMEPGERVIDEFYGLHKYDDPSEIIERDVRELKILNAQLETQRLQKALVQEDIQKEIDELKQKRMSALKLLLDIAEAKATQGEDNPLTDALVSLLQKALRVKLGLQEDAPYEQEMENIRNKINELEKKLSDMDDKIKELHLQHDQLSETIEVKKRFIADRWGLFSKKHYYSHDLYGLEEAANEGLSMGSGQLVAVIDSFRHSMPSSLAARCTNYAEIQPTFKMDESKHGLRVADVLMNTASGAMFEAFDSFLLAWPVYGASVGEQPIIEIKGQRLSFDECLQIKHLIVQKAKKITIQVENEIFYFKTSALCMPEGQVVNLSLSYGDTLSSVRGPFAGSAVKRLVRAMASYINMIEAGKLLIFGSGNSGTVISSHNVAYSMLRNLAKLYPGKFLAVNALASDGMTLTSFGNQPGDHELNQILVCAPGENIQVIDENGTTSVNGTSFAAPFVSGIAAILLSNIPDATSAELCEAILSAATPIIMRPTRKRLHNVPVALPNESMKDLKAGHSYKTMLPDPFGRYREKDVFVTAEMIKAGLEKYGQGRVHLIKAYEQLKKKRSASSSMRPIF